jgi:colanic acid biosynthesis protein WcaH
MLSHSDYIQAIELTQLVSIDLVVYNTNGDVLVGKRKNEPAKGTWFVPGSRLYKNEKWKDAIQRISLNELGCKVTYDETKLIGIYDHIYPTNFMNKRDVNGEFINTHYLCIGLSVLKSDLLINESIFFDQHNDLCWMSPTELIYRDDVHQNTKNYFL